MASVGLLERGARSGSATARFALALAGALVVLAMEPAVGVAGQKVIKASGPLTSIYVDEDLGCQVQATGDSKPSFFGGTEPGACGTFFAFNESEFDLLEGEGRHVFGPKPPSGETVSEAEYKPVSQTLNGSSITTHVLVREAQDEQEVAELTETDSYVTGEDFYTTTITIKNLLAETLAGTLYHAGDCLLSGLATGFGAVNVPSAGSVACTIDPANSPAARYLAFTPTATSGPVPRYYESLFSKVWANVNKEATQFPNTVDAAVNENNGMGLSWPIELPEIGSGKETASVTFTTSILPSAAPTVSTSASTCAPSGQVPLVLSAVNGAKAIFYAVDGGVVQTVATGLAGQATVTLPAGQHKLEYWGEDETGVQSAHQTLNVTVAPGAPTLTITSDQGGHTFEVGEKASVSIVASGPGLTVDPSAAHVPVSTIKPGIFSVSRAATNGCGTTEATFLYTVLTPPTLGKSANVDPVSGKVFVALPPTRANRDRGRARSGGRAAGRHREPEQGSSLHSAHGSAPDPRGFRARNHTRAGAHHDGHRRAAQAPVG